MNEAESRNTGLVHIYCGNGKGKTTAAIGAAVRAAGRGRRVLVARFLKTEDSGEVAGLAHVPGIRLLPCPGEFGFSWNMSPAERAAAASCYRGFLTQAWEAAAGAGGGPVYDMLVLDEAIAACSLGFVEEAELEEALKNRPSGLEVIITGRNPSRALLSQADYITEMVMRRHPYEKGIGAREGIEY